MNQFHHFEKWKIHLPPHYLDHFIAPMMENALSEIWPSPNEKPAPGLLDFGCGTGEKANAFQKIGFETTGIDINPASIEAAKKHFPDVNFVCHDAQKLPFPDDFFEVVHSFSVLQYVDHQKVIAEMHRVLKPGGHLILIENLGNNLFTKTYRKLHRLAGLKYTNFQNPSGYLDWGTLPGLGQNFSKWKMDARHVASPFSLIPSEIKSRILQGSGCFYPPPRWLFSFLEKMDDQFFAAEKWKNRAWLASVIGQK